MVSGITYPYRLLVLCCPYHVSTPGLVSYSWHWSGWRTLLDPDTGERMIYPISSEFWLKCIAFLQAKSFLSLSTDLAFCSLTLCLFDKLIKSFKSKLFLELQLIILPPRNICWLDCCDLNKISKIVTFSMRIVTNSSHKLRKFDNKAFQVGIENWARAFKQRPFWWHTYISSQWE